MFKRVRFFVSCVFGTIFILLGNSAANCISFAWHFLQLCTYQAPPRWLVMLVALVASVIVCLLHAMWRKRGIQINNFFAFFKVLFLILILILALVHARDGTGNLDTETVFQNTGGSSTPNFKGQGAVFLAIFFSYGGWNQANYVSQATFQAEVGRNADPYSRCLARHGYR